MNKKLSILINNLTVFVYLSTLTACTTTAVVDENTTANFNRGPIDGIWIGEFDIRGKGPYDFTAIHLDDKAFAYSIKAKAMCVGTLSFNGVHSLHKYLLFVLDGGPFDWATITGTLKKNEKKQNVLASHFKTLNGGDTGSLDIAYNEIYEQSSSLTNTRGEWIYTDRDNLTTSLSIDKNGLIVGEDSDGCKYSGDIEIIDPNFNVYKVKVKISDCSLVNGEYEGVSFLENGIFNTQIANPKYALYFAFSQKQ